MFSPVGGRKNGNPPSVKVGDQVSAWRKYRRKPEVPLLWLNGGNGHSPGHHAALTHETVRERGLTKVHTIVGIVGKHSVAPDLLCASDMAGGDCEGVLTEHPASACVRSHLRALFKFEDSLNHIDCHHLIDGS